MLTLSNHVEDLSNHLFHAFFAQVHNCSHKALLVLRVVNVQKSAILVFFSRREHNNVVVVTNVLVRNDGVNNDGIDNSVNEMFIFVDYRLLILFCC